MEYRQKVHYHYHYHYKHNKEEDRQTIHNEE